MSYNTDLQVTLEEAVLDVLGQLTGLDLNYTPNSDRFRNIVRQLNRALKANALEHEWSWYASVISVGPAVSGERQFTISDQLRVRSTGDDSVRLCDETGRPWRWAYFLPRDALHKYANRNGLWVAATRGLLQFSRPFSPGEDGLDVQVPVMREPVLFRLPAEPETEVPTQTLEQQVDFDYPDIVVMRAAYLYSLTDPIMQPRAQTLEKAYKDLMYQAIERDDRKTDTPYENNFFVPVQNSIYPESSWAPYPLADERR